MGKYLGIDASTQSMTGLLIDTTPPRILAETSINFDAHLGARYGVQNGVLTLGNGVVHSAPLMWVEALDLLCEALCRQGHDLRAVRAVAGSGQQHGTVYLNDRAAVALSRLRADRPMVEQLEGILSRATAPVWMDTSTAEQCRQIEAAVGGQQALLELTGNTAFERFSGPQIRRFWQTEPEAYRRTACICLVSSFVCSLLAGRLVPVDAGDGSGTNLMDIRTRQWSGRAMDATAPDLAARLLPITPSSRAIGPISPYFAGRHGFSPDCMVVPFSGDNPCSLIGLGLVRPGRVALSLGTSDTLFACMALPRVSEHGEGALFASPDDRHCMALICFLNGSLARQAVRDQYGLDWQGFATALASTPPGNGGALMLPYFAPEIVPHVPRAGVVRQGLDAADAAANVRACIEAQAMASRLHSRWMGVQISSLSVTGGASANEGILQVFADVFGCPVERTETTAAAALGAALRAWHADEREHGAALSWEDVVGPFTRSAGPALEPQPGTAATYAHLMAQYEALERAHTG